MLHAEGFSPWGARLGTVAPVFVLAAKWLHFSPKCHLWAAGVGGGFQEERGVLCTAEGMC